MSLASRRVVLAANTSWYLHNFRTTLMRRLQDAGATVIAVAGPDDYTDVLAEVADEFEEIPFARGGASVRDFRALARCLSVYRHSKPDAVLNFTTKANLISGVAAMVSGVPVVTNVSGLGRSFNNGARSTMRGLIIGGYRIVGRAAVHTFYQNRRDLHLGVQLGISRDVRSSLLPGSGVDVMRFRPRIAARKGRVHFVHVARLMRAKGTFDFLEASERLIKQYPGGVRFSIAGPLSELSDPDREVFREKCERLGVDYVGMTGDVPAFLEDAHAVVLPSVYAEGVPRSLIEASATGKVLICYPNPGCEEIVRHGQNGFVTERPGVDELVKAMAWVVQMPAARYEQICLEACHVARTEFDEQVVIERYLSVLRTLLRRTARTGR